LTVRLAASLRELGLPRWGPVFRKANLERLTRQGVHHTITTLTAARFPPDSEAGGFPTLDGDQRAQITHHLHGDTTHALRARAVLLTGYWGAFRGSELSGLRWGHAKRVDQGIEWRTPKAKNAQLGQGRTTGVPLIDDPLLCPVQGIDDWRARLEQLIRRPVRARDYVICALNHGTPDPTRRLSRDALTNLVAATTKPPVSAPATRPTASEPASSPPPSTPAPAPNKSPTTAAGPTPTASASSTAAARPGHPPTRPSRSPRP
jgi:integrase